MFTYATSGSRRRSACGGAILFVSWALISSSCGGGDGTGTPVTPPAPRPARQLTGFEIFAEQTTIRVGQAIGPLVAYGQYDDGTTGTVTVSWTSSDPAVAEVAEDGTVTGVRVGTATITASFEEFTETIALEVDQANVRTIRDQPDDMAGPQIHVVYALPSDAEDQNLDRYGYIARSFEQIQDWLVDAIGYRLRLDTHGGELDVSFLRLPFTSTEIRSAGFFEVMSFIYEEIAAQIGARNEKTYAVFYFGESVFGGLAAVEPKLAVTMVDTVTRRQRVLPGQHPEGAAYWEAVMVHELLHTFGAVPTCAPHEGRGFHVTDSGDDLMYGGFYENPEDGVGNVAIDVGRDDYFEHGRADCLDTAHNPFWERVAVGREVSGPAKGFHFEAGSGDWPFRCGVH